MKKTSLLCGALVALTLAGCNQEQLNRQQQTIDSLNVQMALKDSSMSLIATTLADINSNIQYIKEKEGIIAVQANDKNNRDQLTNDIQAIYARLVDNKTKLKDLHDKLNTALGKNSEYKKIIDVLEAQIEQQNAEIAKLNSILEGKDVEIGFLNNAVMRLSYSVDSLATVSSDTQKKLDSTTEELNTGYYIVAERGTLRDKGLLEGGLFNKRVLKGSVDNSLFTRIDVTTTEQIPLAGRRFKVLTSHPESSYSIDEEKKLLIIKDKKAFWNSSRYLIVSARSID